MYKLYPYGERDPYASIELIASTFMESTMFDADQMPVLAARVSHANSGKTGEDQEADIKLMNFLAKHKHMTPFEHQHATFKIVLPLFVVREWHRHRTQCLSGDSVIRFNRPCDKKPYYKTIKELFDMWETPIKAVKRPDKQKRNMRDYKRDLIRKMTLPCITRENTIEDTNITDVIFSGRKKVYRIDTVQGNNIKASKDHKFLTINGWKTLDKLVIGDKIKTIGSSAIDNNKDNTFINFSDEEIASEIWKDTQVEGYDVSNLGRIRSYFRQGSKERHDPLIKKITKTANNRAVVSISNKAYQVSSLVAKAFLGTDNGNTMVLHKNDNALDNRVTNLYYGNDKDNARDRIENNRQQIKSVTYLDVKSITYIGEEDTYDISVQHKDHNFIANGFCTHNSYNEVSMRYSENPVGKFFYPNMWREQATRNKQSSAGNLSGTKQLYANDILKEVYDTCLDGYNKLIEIGVCREQARITVPVGNYTEMYATASLRNWFGFCLLRCDETAQKEIRDYADCIATMLEEVYPNSWGALKKGLDND